VQFVNAVKSLATTVPHDFHVYVREMIFVFEQAHGQRKGGKQ